MMVSQGGGGDDDAVKRRRVEDELIGENDSASNFSTVNKVSLDLDSTSNASNLTALNPNSVGSLSAARSKLAKLISDRKRMKGALHEYYAKDDSLECKDLETKSAFPQVRVFVVCVCGQSILQDKSGTQVFGGDTVQFGKSLEEVAYEKALQLLEHQETLPLFFVNKVTNETMLKTHNIDLRMVLLFDEKPRPVLNQASWKLASPEELQPYLGGIIF